MSKKIACLGAGSLYFRRAISDLVEHPDLTGSELVLYDLVPEKSRRMAALGRRMAGASGTGCTVRMARSLEEAIDGADFIVTSIGGSGAGIARNVYSSYFHSVDVGIGRKYGIEQIIGDTGGPAAMMMAFRSIPVYLEICRLAEKHAPHAILFSHSNPMAILCRAMRKHSRANVVGVCHGVQCGVQEFARILEIPARELDCLWIGTNHYYWVTRLTHRGRDMRSELNRRITREGRPDTKISDALSSIHGHRILYAPDDHLVEFYPFLTQLRHGLSDVPHLAEIAKTHFPTHSVPFDGPPRVSAADRAEFFRGYQKMLDEWEKPDPNEPNHIEESLAAMLSAIASGRRELVIANLANHGCIPNLPATAEVEIEAVTDSHGLRGVHMGEAPLALKGMLEKRFAWMEFVVDAAVTGDRHAARQALQLDEMAILPDRADAMLEELLFASRHLLPQFFPARRARSGRAS